jgi:hypothetical protein
MLSLSIIEQVPLSLSFNVDLKKEFVSPARLNRIDNLSLFINDHIITFITQSRS